MTPRGIIEQLNGLHMLARESSSEGRENTAALHFPSTITAGPCVSRTIRSCRGCLSFRHGCGGWGRHRATSTGASNLCRSAGLPVLRRGQQTRARAEPPSGSCPGPGSCAASNRQTLEIGPAVPVDYLDGRSGLGPEGLGPVVTHKARRVSPSRRTAIRWPRPLRGPSRRDGGH
jgi:hypothetical protein